MAQPTDLQLAWEFVGDYYPNYSQSQEISDSDLLQRVVDLEFDPEDEDDSANQLYKEIGEEFTDDEGTILRIAEERMTKLNAEIYERAIVEYMKLKQDKEQKFNNIDQKKTEQFNDSQLDVIQNMQSSGFNVVTCGSCGSVILVDKEKCEYKKNEDGEDCEMLIYCGYCDQLNANCDAPDYIY